jgi:hypothetical protein
MFESKISIITETFTTADNIEHRVSQFYSENFKGTLKLVY